MYFWSVCRTQYQYVTSVLINLMCASARCSWGPVHIFHFGEHIAGCSPDWEYCLSHSRSLILTCVVCAGYFTFSMVCKLLNPFLSNSCIQGCSASADIWRNTHCRLDPRPSDLWEFWNPAACCIKGTATGFSVALKPSSRVHLGCVCVCVRALDSFRQGQRHLRSQLRLIKTHANEN